MLTNFTYCDTVWHFCKAVDTRKLERVQGRALLAIFNNITVAYEKLLKWADIPSLENRHFQDILILMYKVKYNLVPKSISDIFCNYNNKYNQRNLDFPIPRYSTVSYGRHNKVYWTLSLG